MNKIKTNRLDTVKVYIALTFCKRVAKYFQGVIQSSMRLMKSFLMRPRFFSHGDPSKLVINDVRTFIINSNEAITAHKRMAVDWVISIIALICILGLMGTMDSEEEAISASVVEETKISAKAEMLNHKREMAAIDARARYMTAYDQIQIAEVRP